MFSVPVAAHAGGVLSGPSGTGLLCSALAADMYKCVMFALSFASFPI